MVFHHPRNVQILNRNAVNLVFVAQSMRCLMEKIAPLICNLLVQPSHFAACLSAVCASLLLLAGAVLEHLEPGNLASQVPRVGNLFSGGQNAEVPQADINPKSSVFCYCRFLRCFFWRFHEHGNKVFARGCLAHREGLRFSIESP